MADVEVAAPQPTGDQSSTSSIYDRLNDPKGMTASDMRNGMLVVAALISAATFTSGMNPAGGVYQDGNLTGKAILGATNFPVYKAFYFLNAAAFSSANLVIGCLVYSFPYYPEIWGAMVCMSAVYGISTAVVSPKDMGDKLIWLALAVPYIIRIIVEGWKRFKNKCCE